MKKSKPVWQSKTLWGILIAAGGFFLHKFGIEVPAPANPNADFVQMQSYINQVKCAQGSMKDLASIAMNAAGFIMAFWGRLKADSALGVKK